MRTHVVVGHSRADAAEDLGEEGEAKMPSETVLLVVW